MAGSGVASALHCLGGAAGCVRDTFPGALRSRRELSLAGALVTDIWRPPTYVGSRDHAPTAYAAPHFTCFRRGMDFGPVDDHPFDRRSQNRIAQDRVRAARRAARR